MSGNEGITPTERYLGRLCRRSFLSLWSYQNLHTDEGRKSATVPGHELCDLLVVFGNSIIIFSDKHVAFQRHKPIKVAWPRWFRKAVTRSARQLHGAEAWIRNYPHRIFLDRQCAKPFPIDLPDPENMEVFLIAVSTGVYEACHEYFGRESIGSLMISTDVRGSSHERAPFCVGWIDPERKFVHVFEEFTLDAVFSEIDTISDFVAYLRKREEFLTRETPIIISPGEEQLLSIYLTKLNANDEHDFVLPGADEDSVPDFVALDESFWLGMVNDHQYKRKKEADRISYVWDRLIEHFAARGGSYNSNFERSEALRDIELGLRAMASEPRLRRRQLATAFVDLLETTAAHQRKARVACSTDFPDNAYIFLVLPRPDGEDYKKYRQARAALLAAYCYVVKLRCTDAQYVIGIATESCRAQGASEDLVFLDVRNWTDEMNTEAIRLQQEGGLLLEENVHTSEGLTNEYPDAFFEQADASEQKLRARTYRNAEKRKRKMQKNSRRRNRRR